MAKQIVSANSAKIKVIGVGGGGSNAVTRMVREEIPGVEFYALNTDAQSLQLSEAPNKVQLGEKFTRGLGAGGDPGVGARAAMESRDELRDICGGADMIFITCGMGGGTGTGAAPVVAEMAKETGALVIGVVTKPFGFEGAHRRMQAEDGIAKLQPHVDTLIAIPNDRLLQLCDSKTVVDSAFKMADDILRQAVESIASVITMPGLINLDFADIRSVMKGAGPAWLSIGKGTGTNRATDAAKAALASPLLDVSIEGARGVLYNVCGSSNLTLNEVNEAAAIIAKAVDPMANIIFGVVFDPRKDNEVSITLVATGFRVKGGAGPKLEDVKQLIKNMDTDSEVDVPSFLRRPLTLRREQFASRSNVAPHKIGIR